MIWPLKNKVPALPALNGVGDFASRRSFYHHPGVDIYCDFGQEVVAIEDGIVTNIEFFTGPNAEPTSPWWNETQSIMIEGESGALGYCELEVYFNIEIGQHVHKGQRIGSVVPVLKKDKGNGTTMLHFEKYIPGTKEHVTWVLDKEMPGTLLNPRPYLEKIMQNPTLVRGLHDGLAGMSPTDATDEYLSGYLAGRKDLLSR